MIDELIHNKWIKLCIVSTETTIYCVLIKKMYNNGIYK